MKRMKSYQSHHIIRLGRVVILIEKKPKVRKVKVPYGHDLGYVLSQKRLL